MFEAASPEHGRMWRHSPDLLSVIDMGAATFDSVNPAWSATLGWSGDELQGVPYAKFVHPDDMDASTVAFGKVILDDPALRFENRCRHKDGSYRWISWILTADAGAYHCVGRDVTEQKAQAAALARAEEALHQARKMEAVGQLAGGIAHDFNNMLGVVIGSLDLLKCRVSREDQRAVRYVEAASDGARRAAVLTQRLLDFSRQHPLQPETIEVNRLVIGMSELIKGSLGGDIRLQAVLAPGLWPIRADANQLESVLLNLAVNARDAMPKGGQLIIETRNADLHDHDVMAYPGASAGPYVLIAVTDTGLGMPKEVIDRVFEPFFTTKELGKGTGLGLSQVRDFVNQSGGHVEIDSEPGQGTTVNLYLPGLVDPTNLSAGNLTVNDEA